VIYLLNIEFWRNVYVIRDIFTIFLPLAHALGK